MPEPSTNSTDQLKRRKRRLLSSIPFGVTAWVVLAGLPVAPAAPTPGTMHSEIITLTGAKGDPTPGLTSSALRSAPGTAGPGWSAAIDVEDGTQAVAASWTDAPTGVVSVRGHGADGWTEWVELESDPDDAPDDSIRNTGGMAWFGSAGVDDIELEVVAGELSDLEVQPMRYEAP